MARKIFKYRGYTIEELKEMSLDEFIELLPARQRRSLKRGFLPRQQSVLDKMRKLQKQDKKGGKPVVVRTHCRDMIDFVEVTFTPEMLGCFFGEFAPTRARVQHGDPGMGATRSSMFVPLK